MRRLLGMGTSHTDVVALVTDHNDATVAQPEKRYMIVLRASLTTKNQEPSRMRRLLGSGESSSMTMHLRAWS